MTEFFNHDYLIMDEFGRKEIKCMACGKIIASRVEKPSEKFPKRTHSDFMKYPDYCESPYFLKDGSIAFLIFCDEHCDIETSEMETERMSDQLARAKRAELKYMGRRQSYIDLAMEGFKRKTVERKVSPEELNEKLKNLSLV